MNENALLICRHFFLIILRVILYRGTIAKIFDVREFVNNFAGDSLEGGPLQKFLICANLRKK